MVEFSQVKVISQDLVNIFFNTIFQTFSVFSQTYRENQILMHRNLDFLVKALAVVGVLFVSALMSSFIFLQKIAIFRPKEIMITPCDRLLEHELFHMCFSMILLTFEEHLFRETSLNGCFRLLQYRGFTREINMYISLGKHCYQEYLNVEIPHSKLFQGEYLFPGGSTYLLVNKYWGSSYFPENNYWGVLFTREYLLPVTPE